MCHGNHGYPLLSRRLFESHDTRVLSQATEKCPKAVWCDSAELGIIPRQLGKSKSQTAGSRIFELNQSKLGCA